LAGPSKRGKVERKLWQQSGAVVQKKTFEAGEWQVSKIPGEKHVNIYVGFCIDRF
jgi:hypothetical protein